MNIGLNDRRDVVGRQVLIVMLGRYHDLSGLDRLAVLIADRLCVHAPLDAFRDLSVACRCQVRREPVLVVNRRDPRTTRSAPIRRVAGCVGGAC
jgi:hypothetical protein